MQRRRRSGNRTRVSGEHGLIVLLVPRIGGASGGCVSGRAELVELCRQKARPYLFSNSVAPPIVAGALEVANRSGAACVVAIACDRGDRYFAPMKWEKHYEW